MQRMIWSVLVLVAWLCGGVERGWPQDSKAERSSERKVAAYRLDFSINELEDGKRINERHYSMKTLDTFQELKIGTRVPVEAEHGSFQYLDVGTNIRCRVFDSQGSPGLDVKVEISNFALPDQAKGGSQPIVRQMVISGSTLVTLDKPMLIGVVDDPNSKRQFQLEVTVAKLK
jgi:hypothetical protein